MTHLIVNGISAMAGGVLTTAATLAYQAWVKPVPKPSIVATLVKATGEEIKHLPQKCNLKTVAISVGVVATTYVVVKHKLIGKFVDYCVPGMRALKTKMGMEPPVEVCAHGVKSTVYESLRAGSEQVALPMPRYQVLVGFMKDGVFKANGCGVRMGEWLVVPGHVFAPCKPVAVKGNQSWLELSNNVEHQEIDTDLYAIKLTERQWSILGVSAAKILSTLEMGGDWASIVGPSGVGSTGFLRHDHALFGRLIYGGSTVAGYSGAGYNAGGSLAGIHTNGGAVNSGYSAAYVQCLLNRFDHIFPEESSEWLQQIYQEKRPLKLDRRLEGGEVNIFADGLYTTVQKSSLIAAFGKDWENALRSNRPKHNDVHYESLLSGEAKDSKSGASSLLEKSPSILKPEHQKLMENLVQLSTSRLKELTRLLREPQTNTVTLAVSEQK